MADQTLPLNVSYEMKADDERQNCVGMESDEELCFSSSDSAEELYSSSTTDAYRDNSCTTSDRFVNWTAASETHQRESNIFIIQQNNRSVKDRSFSRKIESERSFFIPLKQIFIKTF